MGQAGDRFKKALFAAHRPGKYLEAQADQKAAAEQLKNAERMRAEGMDLAKSLNWEPDYVSDLIGPYQRAESPIARSFLESLLMGENPSMVQGTRLGADRLRAGAQAGFDERTGGWDALYARQRQLEQEKPWWAPGKFSAPAVMPLGGIGPRSVTGVSGGAPSWGGVGGVDNLAPGLRKLMGRG